MINELGKLLFSFHSRQGQFDKVTRPVADGIKAFYEGKETGLSDEDSILFFEGGIRGSIKELRKVDVLPDDVTENIHQFSLLFEQFVWKNLCSKDLDSLRKNEEFLLLGLFGYTGIEKNLDFDYIKDHDLDYHCSLYKDGKRIPFEFGRYNLFGDLNNWKEKADTKLEVFQNENKGEWGYSVFISSTKFDSRESSKIQAFFTTKEEAEKEASNFEQTINDYIHDKPFLKFHS